MAITFLCSSCRAADRFTENECVRALALCVGASASSVRSVFVHERVSVWMRAWMRAFVGARAHMRYICLFARVCVRA
jgi:hypothetical protein